jgi:hypothetical protein
LGNLTVLTCSAERQTEPVFAGRGLVIVTRPLEQDWVDRQAGDVLGIHVWRLTQSSGGTHVHIEKDRNCPRRSKPFRRLSVNHGFAWLSSLKRERKLRTESAEAAGMS